jgi:CRP-like cAMP-binding protein
MRHHATEAGRRVEKIAGMIREWPEGKGLPEREIHTVASLVREVSLPAEWAFITQDTPADATYLLLSGQARVVRDGTVIATLEPGSVIGEMALANRQLRTATVVTTKASQLLHVSAESFEQMQKQCPEATARWLSYTGTRARELAVAVSRPAAPRPRSAPAFG